jgi:RND family efflux transporter MFP subunit
MMFTKYLLPALAVAGVIFAVVFVRAGSKPVPASQPVAQPAQAPFNSYIAGAGIVEAATENIAVGTLVAGVVSEMSVKVGNDVTRGQALFKVDDRDLQAELLVRQAQLQTAQSSVVVEEANVADLASQLEKWQSLDDPRAVSKEDLDRKRFAVQVARAKLDAARSQVAAAEAQVKATQINLDRLVVRAPVDGRVLQVKIRIGEFAPAGITAQPLMLVGDVKTLHVRVDVDENDAWRLRPNAPARAFLRGNANLSTALKFVRVEPYVVPKRSLTGDSSERVDTRVLQALYAFDRGELPVYVGQQMDVFIDAPPVTGTQDENSR